MVLPSQEEEHDQVSAFAGADSISDAARMLIESRNGRKIIFLPQRICTYNSEYQDSPALLILYIVISSYA